LTACGPAAGDSAGGHSATGHASTGDSAAARSPGHQHAGSPGAAPVRLLCPDPDVVTTLSVTRIPSIGQLGQTKPLPNRMIAINVGDQAQVRTLARMICALPLMPQGVLSCPPDVGGGLVLTFSGQEMRFHPVTVQASGCEVVLGTDAAQHRWVAGTPGFWTVLAQVTGIRAAAHNP